jgi:hypothetical protein
MNIVSAHRVIALTCLMSISAPAATEPRVFSIAPGVLAHARARVSAEDKLVKSAFDTLLKEANKALRLTPPSVMGKARAGASGDKHDYYSTAPYFWPDPAKPDGLPYIRKDGQRNPESGSEASDAPRLGRMADAAATLALASWFTGQESYAEQAARLLRVWFLDPATRMNPNFNHAQAIPGVNDGRGTGMIESRSLLSVMDAAGLLAGSKHWRKADEDGLRAWMQQFLDWTQTSRNGRAERAAKNNHGTFYDMQVTHLALFTGQTNLARQIVEGAKTNRVDIQIKPDGSQPLELERVDSFGYSRFNLQAHFALATLAAHLGVDLWHYETADGGGIRKALDFLLPYVEQPDKPWPYERGKKQDRNLDAILRQAHAVYGDPRYRDALLKSPGHERERDALFYPVK